MQLTEGPGFIPWVMSTALEFGCSLGWGPISHIASDAGGFGGGVRKYFPGMDTAHPPPHSSTAQPASCCQKNLPEIRCASCHTVTSCSDCLQWPHIPCDLMSPELPAVLILPLLPDTPYWSLCLSSILKEKKQPGFIMCEEEEAAPSADLWGLSGPLTAKGHLMTGNTSDTRGRAKSNMAGAEGFRVWALKDHLNSEGCGGKPPAEAFEKQQNSPSFGLFRPLPPFHQPRPPTLSRRRKGQWIERA